MKWKVSRKEMETICLIVARAQKECFPQRSKLNLNMDITAAHCNDSKLRLTELLKADNFNFAHDICGIVKNLNRETGKLENCFSPKFSL